MPGLAAPDFRLERLEGGAVSLAELRAQGPVLLAFFKISCPVCQMTLPFLERIHAPRRTAANLTAFRRTTPPTPASSRRSSASAFPLLLDSEDDGFPASNAYGISSVPDHVSWWSADGLIGA